MKKTKHYLFYYYYLLPLILENTPLLFLLHLLPRLHFMVKLKMTIYKIYSSFIFSKKLKLFL